MKSIQKAGLVGLLGTAALTAGLSLATPEHSYATHTPETRFVQHQEGEDSGLGKFALYAGLIAAGFIGLTGFRVVRPTERGVVERLGKFNRVTDSGLTYLIPLLDRMYRINVTERMVDAQPQEVITKDNLNATVDAQIYFKVKPDQESIRRSLYNVQNYQWQIVQLTRTTLRDIIGNLTLREANSQRGKLNGELAKELDHQTDAWGIEVVRAELKEIEPPKDVQDTMNKIVKAENEKIAATDFASATETKADGERRAAIKKAEGERQAAILSAEGKAQAIKIEAEAKAQAIQQVSESAEKYFKGAAQDFEKLRVAQEVFGKGTKYVIPQGTSLVTMLEQMNGLTPVPMGPKTDA